MPVNQSRAKTQMGQQASGASDTVVHDARSDDVVIPVIGETGVGKSTFINAAAGKTAIPVGHDWNSYTEHIRHIAVPHPNDPSRRVVFVDAPGFNNTYAAGAGDLDIFDRLTSWLRNSYSESTKISGFIYPQDVSQDSVVGTPLRNMLAKLKKLSCFNGTQSLILATTNGVAGRRRVFINAVAGGCVTKVDSGIFSCTSRVSDSKVLHPDDPTCPVVPVDTPGFNDSSTRDDADTLKRMIEWLEHRPQGTKLVGFIYPHEITQTRIDLSPAVVTPMKFRPQAGVLRNIVLATTKWSEVLSDVGQRYESQLTETYWKDLLLQRMQTTRFTDTRESAWEIIDLVLQQESVDSSLLEQELVQVMTRLPRKTPPSAPIATRCMQWNG
ncbi:hypothetical protein BV22DRAFT_1132205 [Leucogyrophana mollusca]|uniref:Uncharacterized protein n=1 Tax=Leucogyrophana mollusca TaxID=85980 RepID=A0ACB8B7Y7_9AGAM|nr:hypothetical protein BV22DRAFT_1132205 [Leucogyrophana mollusca]